VVRDVVFVADCDRSRQRYVLVATGEISRGTACDVLVVLHGHGGDRWQFVRENRGECRACRDVVAERRMLMVSPDYRGDSWMGPKAEADLIQILRQMRMQYRVRRVFLAGASMGGTAALTFTALHPEMVDGVVALNAVANLVEFDSFEPALEAMRLSFGGTKREIPGEYRRRSAGFFPEKFTMPLAVATGGRDRITPPDSVLRLAEEVKKRGGIVSVIHRKTGGHATSYRDTRRCLEFVLEMAPAGDPVGTAAEGGTGKKTVMTSGRFTRTQRQRRRPTQPR